MEVIKNKLLTVLLMFKVIAAVLSQQDEKEFCKHFDKSKFYLLMTADEVYKILGNPEELLTIKNSRLNFDVVTLRYPGIEFKYFDITDSQEILMIAFWERNNKLGNMNLIGCSKDDILKKHGYPESINTINGYSYFRYEINLPRFTHFVLQFRFNTLGTCDGVILTHSYYFI